MPDMVVLLVAAAVVYLPGLALLYALGQRRVLLVLAMAPAATVTVAGLLAVATGLLGLPYGGIGLLAVTAVLAAVAVVGLVRARRGRSAALDRPAPTARVPVPALALGVLIGLAGIAGGLRTWLIGIGGLGTPPQEHDMIVHAVLTAYIARTGVAAPWRLLPADVLTGEPVAYYPSGVHLLTAATADLTGQMVASINAVTVVFLAVVAAVGVATLGVVAARQLGLGTGSAALVGGTASLVMAGLYRPGFQLMHDGGVLSNAVALALVPGILAGMLCLPRSGLPLLGSPRTGEPQMGSTRMGSTRMGSTRMRVAAAAGVGAAAAGAVSAHPSAAMSIAFTAFLWWLGQMISLWGRRQLRGMLRPLLVAGVVGTVLLVPTVGPGLVTASRTGSFPPDIEPVSFRDALGNTLGFTYGGWLDPQQSRAQIWVAVLVLLGVAALLALRRGLGPVVAWAGWCVVIMAAWTSPGTGFEAPITGFYYNVILRVWSHAALLAPVLAGLGVVLTADRVAVLARRRLPVPAVWMATALIGVIALGYALGPAVRYARVDQDAVASRYRTPDFVRVGADDQNTIEWLAARVRPGERVFNSPNDGSTYLYVERGVPIVNVASLGLPGVSYTYRLLQDFNTYPTDPQVRQQLRELNIRWVYVDSTAPDIGSTGSPEGWAGDDGFRLAPGLRGLEGLPGLTPAFRAGSVTVYALDLDAIG